MEHKKAIMIQRYYRAHILRSKLHLTKTFDLTNQQNMEFNNYKLIMLNKSLIKQFDDFLNRLNILFAPRIELTSKSLLAAFMIAHFPNELIGHSIDRMIVDNVMCDISVVIVANIVNNTMSYNDFKKFHTLLGDYKVISEQWLTLDKNRTIQNIIISYYNRRIHIESITDVTEQTENIKHSLDKECLELLSSIKLIDSSYNIAYLVENYKTIYNTIKLGMNQLYNQVKGNFKKVFCDYLIDEFMNKSNINIIYDLINETNERLLTIVPPHLVHKLTNILTVYQFTDILLESDWNSQLINYFKFILDMLALINKPCNEVINLIRLMVGNNYYDIPIILLDINHIIDDIVNTILKH